MAETKTTDFETPAVDVTTFPLSSSWTLALGAALVFLGAFAATLSMLATLVSVLFVGWLLLVAGVMETGSGLKDARWAGLALHVLNGVCAVVAGALIVTYPGVGAVFLTLLIAFFLAIGGLLRLVSAIANRLPHRGWVGLSGIVALLLGTLIWRQMPEAAVWVIGTFVGIDMMFVGWSWLMLGMVLRRRQDQIR